MPLKLNLTIPNKAVHAFIGLIVLAVIASGVYAYVVSPGTVPNPGHALSTVQGYFSGDASLLDSLSKMQQEVSGACPGQVIVGINADGTVTCETDDTGAAGSPPLVFEVYNPDNVNRACVDKDVEEYCGDADGCTIRYLMTHMTGGSDKTHTVETQLYMEQPPPLSSNNDPVGIFASASSPVGSYAGNLGTTSTHTLLSTGTWGFAYNYHPGWCPGGATPAHTNPYTITFATIAPIRATVIVYDQ